MKIRTMWKLFQSLFKSIREAIARDPEVKHYAKEHPKLAAFIGRRFSPDEKTGLHLTVGIGVAAVFFFYFLDIAEDLIMRESIVAADYRIITLVQMFRTPYFTDAMLFLTYLGTWQVVLAGVFLVAIGLLIAKRRYELWVLAGSIMGGGLFVLLIKQIGHRPRPDLVNALVFEQTFSFPSGHGFIAIVFFGLCAYFLFRAAKSRMVRFGIVAMTLCLVIAIGFSRVYLGVHWPSDVLAGYAVGAAWLVMTMTPLEIRRRFDVTKSTINIPVSMMSRMGIMLFLAWVLFAVYFFAANPLRPSHPPVADAVTVTPGDIGENLFAALPRTSEDIIGEPLQPFNIIVVASRGKLDRILQKAGWYLADPVTFTNFWKLVTWPFGDEPYLRAPAAPLFWDGRPNDILYEKPTLRKSARERRHCYIWKSPFVLGDGRSVWFFTVHMDKGIALLGESLLLPFYTIDPLVDQERDAMLKELKKSGTVKSVRFFKISDQLMGQNMAGDQFFTDGGSYILFLE